MCIRNVIKIFYTFRRIVDSFDDDLSKPRVDASLLKLRKEEIYRFLFASGVFLIILGVAHFIVEQAEIGHFKQFINFIVPNATRSIECGVYAFGFTKCKKFTDEIGLRSRLAARNGDSAVLSEIFAVTLYLFEYLLRAHFVPAREIPRVGIVAIGTAERTSLHKQHKTHAGTVNGPERLY